MEDTFNENEEIIKLETELSYLDYYLTDAEYYVELVRYLSNFLETKYYLKNYVQQYQNEFIDALLDYLAEAKKIYWMIENNHIKFANISRDTVGDAIEEDKLSYYLAIRELIDYYCNILARNEKTNIDRMVARRESGNVLTKSIAKK